MSVTRKYYEQIPLLFNKHTTSYGSLSSRVTDQFARNLKITSLEKRQEDVNCCIAILERKDSSVLSWAHATHHFFASIIDSLKATRLIDLKPDDEQLIRQTIEQMITFAGKIPDYEYYQSVGGKGEMLAMFQVYAACLTEKIKQLKENSDHTSKRKSTIY